MAAAIIPYQREIGERAYLSQMGLLLAQIVGDSLGRNFLTKDKDSYSIDSLIQNAANRVLSKPMYAGKSQLLNEVIANALKYYPSLEIDEFPKDPEIPLKRRLDSWCDGLITRAQTVLLRAHGWEVVPLREKDVPTYIFLSEPIEKISCYEFALMRAGVQEAFPVKWNEKDLISLLDRWNFVPVSRENSRPGDLVLFLDEDKPCHMGIRYKKDVLAKPGNNQKFAFVHKIEEAFASYGDQVLFYRRKLLT